MKLQIQLYFNKLTTRFHVIHSLQMVTEAKIDIFVEKSATRRFLIVIPVYVSFRSWPKPAIDGAVVDVPQQIRDGLSML
jgi:hypothetical protein